MDFAHANCVGHDFSHGSTPIEHGPGLRLPPAVVFSLWHPWLLFSENADPRPDLAVLAVSVMCLGFYGFLLAMLIMKVRRGTWVEFCQRAASEFE